MNWQTPGCLDSSILSEDIIQHIDDVHRFIRFWANKICVSPKRIVEIGVSRVEAQIICELSHHQRTTASRIGNELGIDQGYLSRIISGLKDRGIIEKKQLSSDSRQRLIWLTEHGKESFEVINAHSRNEIEAMLSKLSMDEQKRMVHAMESIESIFIDSFEKKNLYLLRPHEPGDMGWVIFRHGCLYSQEYGFNQQFEAEVASSVADFIKTYDPEYTRSWMVEIQGEVVGSVFLSKYSDSTAKLSLLLVEPKTRGLGIGTRLVKEAVLFAKRAHYQRVRLWSYGFFLSARSIFEKAGFNLFHSQQEHSYGSDFIREIWDLKL